MSDYFLEIEGHFALRRNTPFILSAKDWALMKGWQEDGIPLPVVIEAIDLVFERNETSGRKKTISSLSYCKHAVKELWEERRDLYIGDSAVSPEESFEPLLDALATAVGSAPFADADAYAQRVRELVREKSVPKVEEALIELERELIEHILTTMPTDDAASLRAAVAKALGDTSKLDEKTRARTEEANLRRLLRERFALPRLSLF